MNRVELKNAAKEQIKGNIGMLFLCYLVISLLSGVGSIFLSAPLTVGLLAAYLRMTNGEKPEVGRLFDSFSYYGKTLGLTVLIALFTTLWSLLFIIPGIIKGISYSQALLILADHPEKGVFECLDESKAMMEGHKWEYFVLGLSFILWIIATPFTLGLLAIYLNPYMQATFTNYYLQLRGPEVQTQIPDTAQIPETQAQIPDTQVQIPDTMTQIP